MDKHDIINQMTTLKIENSALREEVDSMREGRHPCPTCDCPMYHRAKTGWYCPECELQQASATIVRCAASEAQLCRARELLDDIYNNCGCEEEDGTLCANCDRNIAFFADKATDPCPHEAENARLREAVGKFREAFVIAVGDKSPFAKIALRKLDSALAALKEG